MVTDDTDAVRLLGEQIIFVANLPATGACVLVESAVQRYAIRDLILMHRGVAVFDLTRVHVCLTETDEMFAVAGRDPCKVFAAPGFTPKCVRAGGSEMRRIQGLDRPRQGVASSPTPPPFKSARSNEPPPREEVPGALRHAWFSSGPATIPENLVVPVPAAPVPQSPNSFSYRANVPADAPTALGPWHKPSVAELVSTTVEIKSVFLADVSSKPYRLSYEFPDYGGYVEVFDTQEEADAALPAFARTIRERLAGMQVRDRTTVRLAA